MINAIKPMCRAVCWGALAGGGPFLIITVPVSLAALFDDSLGAEKPLVLFFAVSPLLCAALASFAGLVFIGMPLTTYLHRLGEESARTYRAAGLGFGFLLPLLVAALLTGFSGDLFPFGLLFAALGAAAGRTTAAVWGSWRESIAAGHKTESTDHPNRYHDERILR
jgi:hypothetical protein